EIDVLSVSPKTVPAGGTITATWGSITNPAPTDWIGFYDHLAPGSAPLDWMYVSCSKTPGSARASGSCPFPVPSPLAVGGYELRLFVGSGGATHLATSNVFAVTRNATLSVTPTTVPPGGTVTGTWNGVTSPTPSDWIGLYALGAGDTEYIDWIYVSCS